MSEYIKGELREEKSRNGEDDFLYYIEDKEKILITAFHRTNKKERAVQTHFVKCWNCHDDLLAACELGLNIARWFNHIRNAPKQLFEDVEQIQQAVIKAKT